MSQMESTMSHQPHHRIQTVHLTSPANCSCATDHVVQWEITALYTILTLDITRSLYYKSDDFHVEVCVIWNPPRLAMQLQLRNTRTIHTMTYSQSKSLCIIFSKEIIPTVVTRTTSNQSSVENIPRAHIDSLYLLVTQVPRPRDMAIFVLTTTTTTTRPITLPLAHARGVTINHIAVQILKDLTLVVYQAIPFYLTSHCFSTSIFEKIGTVTVTLKRKMG